MKQLALSVLLLFSFTSIVRAQTDVSLFVKNGDQEQLEFIESKRGNLFRKLGHHGPAVENSWYGLRIYFDKKGAIDVYSKAEQRLELKEKQWYPTKTEQSEGWGADYYKAGKTVGLGGIKLYDEEQIIDLHPVSMRSARVWHYGDSACMEMLSEGVPYKGENVDINVRVTVYSNERKAKVEARSLHGKAVQFVTGINFFDKLEVVKTDHYIATWGIHPEDVAAEKNEVGAAIYIPSEYKFEIQKLKNQYILISEPQETISVQITSANKREKAINSMEDFLDLLEKSIDQ